MVTIKRYNNDQGSAYNFGKYFIILLFVCSLIPIIFKSNLVMENTLENIQEILHEQPQPQPQPEKTIKKQIVNQSELRDQFTSMISKFYKNRNIAIKKDTLRNSGAFEVTLNSNFFYNFITDFQKEVLDKPNDNSIYYQSINLIINYSLYIEGKTGNLHLLNSITNLSQESQQYLLSSCKIVTQSSLRSKPIDSLDDSSNLKLLKLYAEELSIRLFSKWMIDFYSYLGDVRELRSEFGMEVYNVADLLNIIPIVRGYDKIKVLEFIDFVKDKL